MTRAVPGFEAGKVRCTRVANGPGQFDSHVRGEKLEIGIDVATFCRERNHRARAGCRGQSQQRVVNFDGYARKPPIGFRRWNCVPSTTGVQSGSRRRRHVLPLLPRSLPACRRSVGLHRTQHRRRRDRNLVPGPTTNAPGSQHPSSSRRRSGLRRTPTVRFRPMSAQTPHHRARAGASTGRGREPPRKGRRPRECAANRRPDRSTDRRRRRRRGVCARGWRSHERRHHRRSRKTHPVASARAVTRRNARRRPAPWRWRPLPSRHRRDG